MADETNDDQELYLRMARGDESAFVSLYERYQRGIFRFAWHMSGNGATAEEITQEVFMQLIQNPHRFDPAKGSVAGYMYGIARNLTRRGMRKDVLHFPITEGMIDSGEEGLAIDFDLLAAMGKAELVECLRKAVQALPEQYREVLVLRDLEQVGHLEAAELLQCAPGTVASRLHRARAMVKMRLKGMGVA